MSASPQRLRAPGKLVLMGEYAVLDGAPAIVLAVNRGVEVQVRAGDAALQIETPDGDDRFVRAALAGQRGRFTFSAWNPVEGIAGKPGFGGSAAACVVACLAAGRPLDDAYALHRAAQGSGSGVDVAASARGGMLRFTLAAPGGAPPQLQALPPLRPVVVWSGQSARTGPRLVNYQTWRGRADFADESASLVDAFVEQPIPAMRAARRALEAMAKDAGLDYRHPALDRAIALAEGLGGAAKASGAGGGDCAVALLPDAGAEAAYLTALQKNDLQTISIEVAGPPGPA